MILDTTRFVASKHPIVFKNQKYFVNHNISPKLQKILCIQTGLIIPAPNKTKDELSTKPIKRQPPIFRENLYCRGLHHWTCLFQIGSINILLNYGPNPRPIGHTENNLQTVGFFLKKNYVISCQLHR